MATFVPLPTFIMIALSGPKTPVKSPCSNITLSLGCPNLPSPYQILSSGEYISIAASTSCSAISISLFKIFNPGRNKPGSFHIRGVTCNSSSIAAISPAISNFSLEHPTNIFILIP